MRLYSFYHQHTGILHMWKFGTTDDTQLANNTPAEHVSIEGHLDHMSQRIDVATGAIIDYQPLQPSADHEWNESAKRWQLNAASREEDQAKRAASARKQELAAESQDHMRRLALDPKDTDARTALQHIQAQINALDDGPQGKG